ncbi:DUF2283 domain-containing protein [candidate division KSB1 bacterium]|nr:DUF2283 domain-containing protein [candidate division KSB1 bacterium]
MELSYDSSYNIAYIKLRQKSTEVESIKVSDELVIDMTADGKIYGIELLNANEQLGLSLKKSFTFINEQDDKKLEVAL